LGDARFVIIGAVPIAVSSLQLTKIYRRYASPFDRLREKLSRQPRHQAFTALHDVSFEIPRGSGFGIIGENGAGKSTLLKILAGVSAPTSGEFSTSGTVASILELGSGFHPELTGRQNIRLNAALLGLDDAAIRARTPAILEFGELGEFIDQPVKTYSSGMAMRLAFSIATQVEPEVLIIDEALSVGDGYFQKKCMDRLSRFLGDGGTLLLCSHAMYYVSAFCSSSLWLRHGEVAAYGPTPSVVRDYEVYLTARNVAASGSEARLPEADLAGPARFTDVTAEPAVLGTRRAGESIAVNLAWESDDASRAFHVGVGLNRSDEVEVFSLSTAASGLAPFAGARRYRVTLRIPNVPLVKGEFTIYAFLLDEQALHVYDRRILPRALVFHREQYAFGLVEVPHEWSGGGVG
jgi:ABC-type polysaccharide/polyol phosphate transport system ATPase subunit